ncbi:MAG: hypothetical protein ACO3AC_08055 [Hylemonella sp.]
MVTTTLDVSITLPHIASLIFGKPYQGKALFDRDSLQPSITGWCTQLHKSNLSIQFIESTAMGLSSA